MDGTRNLPSVQNAFYKVSVPAALGACIGCVFLVEPTEVMALPDVGFHLYPWVPSLAVLGLILGFLAITLLLTRLDWLFARRDAIAVMALVAAVAFTGFNFGPADSSDFALVSVSCFWLMATFVEHRPIRTPIPLLCLLGGLVFFLLASSVHGQVTTIRTLHTLFTKMALLFLITNLVVTPALHRLAVKTLVGVALFSAVVGIGFQLLYLFKGIAITFDDLPEFRFKDTPFGRMLRATALLPRSQLLGHLLIMGTSLTLFIPMALGKRIVCLIILCVGTAFTFSAGAFLSMGVILLLSVFVRRPARSLHYLAYICAISFVGYVSGGLEWVYKKLVVPVGGAGLSDRLEYTRVGLHAVERHPLLGGGLGNIGRLLDTLVHNTYLQMAADVGVMGGSLFTAMIISLTVVSGLVVRFAATAREKNLLKGVFLGMIGISVHFCVEPFYNNVGSWMYFGLVASTCMIYSRPNRGTVIADAEAARN